jgi:hypothetical protein
VQNRNRYGVAEELELFHTIMVREPDGTFVVIPHVLVPHFVRGKRLQLFHGQQAQRCFRNQEHCPGVKADGCLRHVNDLDAVHGVALGRLQYGRQPGQLRQRPDVQVGDFAACGQRTQDSHLVFWCDWSGAPNVQPPEKSGRIGPD